VADKFEASLLTGATRTVTAPHAGGTRPKKFRFGTVYTVDSVVADLLRSVGGFRVDPVVKAVPVEASTEKPVPRVAPKREPRPAPKVEAKAPVKVEAKVSEVESLPPAPAPRSRRRRSREDS
jgi:hypothetical protein